MALIEFIGNGLVCSVLMGNAGYANCPSPEAMQADGIYVSYENGAYTHYSLDSAARIVDDYYSKEFGLEYRTILYKGVYVAREYEMFGVGKPNYASSWVPNYAIDEASLPLMEPDVRWTSTHTVTNKDDAPFPEILSIAAGNKVEVLAIAGCQLSVLPYLVRLNWPEDKRTKEGDYYYLVDYGVSIALQDTVGGVTIKKLSGSAP